MKTCNTCGLTYELSKKYWVVNKGKPVGARCRQCVNAAYAEYKRGRYHSDLEFKTLLASRQIYSEKRRLLTTNWRENNHDRWIEICKKSEKNRDKTRRYANARKVLAARMQRLASWANKEMIIEFYKEAKRLTLETGIRHEVDHILPLNGKLVSGLHVECNLRVVTISENRRKSNKLANV